LAKRIVSMPCCTIKHDKGRRTGESNVVVAAIANTHVPSIKIHIRIVHNGKRIDAHRLLDSGAEGMFYNANFAKAHQFSQEPIESPIYP
jgi:hypothetical protein